MIEIKADTSELEKAMKLLSGMPEKIQRVKNHVSKEAGKVIASGISQGITREYYVKRTDVLHGIRTEFN